MYFLIFLILGLSFFLIIFRNKIFVIWIGLELLVFVSVSIFSIKKSTIFKNFKKMFFYFVIQTLGSLLIIFSFFKKTQILFAIGILIKLGVFPFFFLGSNFFVFSKMTEFIYFVSFKKDSFILYFSKLFWEKSNVVNFSFFCFSRNLRFVFFVKSF